MKESWKQKLRTKGILAVIIAVICMVPITAIMTLHDLKYISKRENEQLEVRKNIADNVVEEINSTLASAEERYERNLSAKAALMADYLKSFVSDKGYEGPRVFFGWVCGGTEGRQCGDSGRDYCFRIRSFKSAAKQY